MDLLNGDWGEDEMVRNLKISCIFKQFDVNEDGGLNREEMTTMVVSVNKLQFSGEQLKACLDKVFETYGEFIDGDKGLTLEGLRRTYDDGAGNVDHDFEALKLQLPPQELNATSAAPTDIHKPPPVPAKGGFAFESTRVLIEDLEILLRRYEKSDTTGTPSLDPSPALSTQITGLRERADAESAESAAEGHLAMGRVLTKRGLLSDSLLSLERAVHVSPESARAHFLYGNALFSADRNGDAREQFEHALSAANLDQNSNDTLLPQIHVNLGIALEGEGMLFNACEQYREAAILNPEAFKTLTLLGSAQFALADYKGAAEALQNALFLNPNYADAHCELGTTLHAMGEDERAEMELRKAIELEGGHVEALYNLAGLQRDVGRFVEAIDTYTQVLELDPRSWKAELNRAVALLGAKRVTEAEAGLLRTFKMSKRVEVYDALRQLKFVARSKSNRKLTVVLARMPEEEEAEERRSGVTDSVVPEPSLSLVVEGELMRAATKGTSTPLAMKQALEMRRFQRVTRLSSITSEALREQISDSNLPLHASDKMICKSTLEKILRRVFKTLSPEAFQESTRALNERIILKLGRNNTHIDLALFLALLALLAGGQVASRKRTAFEALTWRRLGDETLISKEAVDAFVGMLQAVYLTGETLPVLPIGQAGVVMKDEGFGETLDRELPILKTLSLLETHDRTRHKNHHCEVCAYVIVGPRYREVSKKFNLCANCYSECKVPTKWGQKEFVFKEALTGSDLLMDRLSSFGLRGRGKSL